MKKENGKNVAQTLAIIAAVLVIAAISLFAMTAGNFGKRDVPPYPVDTSPTSGSEPSDIPSEVITTPTQETEPVPTTEAPASETEPAVTEPDSPDGQWGVSSEQTTEAPATEDTSESEAPATEPVPEEYADKDGEYTGVVYLTFDDGPSKLTSQVLDILKEHGVNATFFVISFSEGQDWKVDLMKRALDEGNKIGLHGSSHKYEEVYQSVDATVNCFYNENKLLYDALGVDIRLMRFPGGSSNTVSKNYCENVMTDSAKILTENGYNYFDWNVSSSDAGSAHDSSEDIFQNVIKGVRPSRTNVVLMHDGSGHDATIEALPRIIEWLADAGYKFEVITDSTPKIRHNISN